LTNAFLLKRKDIKPIILFQNNLISNLNLSYYLVIYSVHKEYTKIFIYPLDSSLVLKLILSGKNINSESINKIINVLKNFKILHSSGIVSVNDKFLYEVYIYGYLRWRDEITNYYYIIKNIEGIDSLEEEWIKLSKMKKRKINNLMRKTNIKDDKND